MRRGPTQMIQLRDLKKVEIIIILGNCSGGGGGGGCGGDSTETFK